MSRTREEGRLLYEARQELTKLEEEIEEHCERIANLGKESALKEFLFNYYEKYYAYIYCENIDDDGFKFVRNTRASPLLSWLECRELPQLQRKASPLRRDINDLLQQPPKMLTRTERLRLKVYWTKQMRELYEEKLQTLIKEHRAARHDMEKLYAEGHRRCLSQAEVIGATPTGLATNSELLRSIPSKVLICEEAGEVLESHVLTALLPSCQHAILIGDHLQLRPQIGCYDLSMESDQGKMFRLDCSLFE